MVDMTPNLANNGGQGNAFAGYARVNISPNADLQRIVEIAQTNTPGFQTDLQPVYSHGRLYVPGVSQDTLTRAAGQVVTAPTRTTEVRVYSVLPVAFRVTLANMPAPVGAPAQINDMEDAVTAAVASMPKAYRIAWEYADNILRADLVQLGAALQWDEDLIDTVLSAAAALPGSGAVMEEMRPDGSRVLYPKET